MNKAEKYIKKRHDSIFEIVDKKFGNGKQLIKFFYNSQVNGFGQGFLAYVDNQKWLRDRSDVMDEVQQYLAENYGIIDDEDFIYVYNEDNNTNYTLEDLQGFLGDISNEMYNIYWDWYKEQFPKIDPRYGGVCHYSAVNLKEI